MRTTPKVWLTQEQQDDFERFARSRTLAARLVQRARIVLMAAARKPDQEIAQALGIARQTAALWRGRFVQHGIARVEKDAPPSRRPTVVLPPQSYQVVGKTTRQTPPDATHCSPRRLPAATRGRPS